jgi:hypothetical protein
MNDGLRPLSLVRLKEHWAAMPHSASLPFIDDQPLVFLGENPNMPEHGVFVGHRSGSVYSGFHIEQFRELNQSEN